MQTKAVGSRMKPTRREHFPVQHMLPSPLLRGEYALSTRVCASQRHGMTCGSGVKGGGACWRGKLTSVGEHMSNRAKVDHRPAFRARLSPPHLWDNYKNERSPRTGGGGTPGGARRTLISAHHANIPFLPFMAQRKQEGRLVLQRRAMKSLFAEAVTQQGVHPQKKERKSFSLSELPLCSYRSAGMTRV